MSGFVAAGTGRLIYRDWLAHGEIDFGIELRAGS